MSNKTCWLYKKQIIWRLKYSNKRIYNLSEIESYNGLNENNKISLAKGCTYIIEIKTDIDLIIVKIVHINKVQDRFIESFKNVTIN